MSMYTLTHLTGRKKNEGRTTVVQGFEFQRKTLMIVAWSTAASLIPSVLLALTISPFLMVIIPLTVAGLSWWGFISRRPDGLKLTRYQSLMDKRKSDPGVFYFCFEPMPDSTREGMIQRQTVDVRADVEDADTEVPVVSAMQDHTKRSRKGNRANRVKTQVFG